MFRIKDWQKFYENHETRKLKYLKWVPIPNRHDGAGFRRVAEMDDCCEIFSAWILLLEIASKAEVRGNLPDFPEDAAYKTGFPFHIFKRAYEILSKKEIGWIEIYGDDATTTYEKSEESPGNLPPSPEPSGKTAAELNGMELNGMEEKKTNTVASDPVPVEILEIEKQAEKMAGDTGKATSMLETHLFPAKHQKSVHKELEQKARIKAIVTTKGERFREAWDEFLNMRLRQRKPATPYAQLLVIKTLEELSQEIPVQVKILDQSSTKNWLDVFPLKQNFEQKPQAESFPTPFLDAEKRLLARAAAQKGPTNG